MRSILDIRYAVRHLPYSNAFRIEASFFHNGRIYKRAVELPDHQGLVPAFAKASKGLEAWVRFKVLKQRVLSPDISHTIKKRT